MGAFGWPYLIMKNVKNIRLGHYDYSINGYYFITICSSKRFPNLPQLETLIKNNLESLSTIDGVMLDYWMIMPDHIHIIILLKNCRMKLGELIRRFKAKISKESGCKVWQPINGLIIETTLNHSLKPQSCHSRNDSERESGFYCLRNHIPDKNIRG